MREPTADQAETIAALHHRRAQAAELRQQLEMNAVLQRIHLARLQQDGYSYAELGQVLGVTRQAAYNLLNDCDARSLRQMGLR